MGTRIGIAAHRIEAHVYIVPVQHHCRGLRNGNGSIDQYIDLAIRAIENAQSRYESSEIDRFKEQPFQIPLSTTFL